MKMSATQTPIVMDLTMHDFTASPCGNDYYSDVDHMIAIRLLCTSTYKSEVCLQSIDQDHSDLGPFSHNQDLPHLREDQDVHRLQQTLIRALHEHKDIRL